MIKFLGGEGTSIDDAIIISGALNTMDGIRAERIFIYKILSDETREWRIKTQELISTKDKHYDKITIQIYNGADRVFYFDITDFFGE